MMTPTQKVVCKRCGGKGTVVVAVAQKDGNLQEKVMTCPSCKGSGKEGYLTK